MRIIKSINYYEKKVNEMKMNFNNVFYLIIDYIKL